MLFRMAVRGLVRGLANSRGGSTRTRIVYHANLLGGWQCKHRHSNKASALRCGKRELSRRRRHR